MGSRAECKKIMYGTVVRIGSSPEQVSSNHLPHKVTTLEGNNAHAAALLHNGTDARRGINSVLVAWGEGALLGNLRGAVVQNVVGLSREALLVRVEVCYHSAADVGEGV